MVINSTMYDKFLEDLTNVHFLKRTLESYFNRSVVGEYQCFLAHPTLALQKEEFTKNSIHNLAFNETLYKQSEKYIEQKLSKNLKF